MPPSAGWSSSQRSSCSSNTSNRRSALAAAHALGLGKQQGQGLLYAVDLGNRQGQKGGQGLHQRVVWPAVKVQRGADEVAALLRRVVKVVLQRARVQQQRGLVQAQPARRAAARAVGDLQLAAAQHMQKSAPGLGRERRHAAQRPGVEEVGAHAKTLQQGGEAIHAGGGRVGLNHGRLAKYRGLNASNHMNCRRKLPACFTAQPQGGLP